MVEAPLKVQCYASPDRTEVLSLPDDDSGATVHARVGGVRAVPLERAEEERLQRWRCLDEKVVECEGLGSGRSFQKIWNAANKRKGDVH